MNVQTEESILRVRSASINENIRREGGLTNLANRIKKLGQFAGTTVEIALAETTDGRQVLVAGINSGSNGFNASQLKQLEDWGINVSPEWAKKMKRGPHAEENMAAYMDATALRGLRRSRAVVGKLRASGNSYVCSACQMMIKKVGGCQQRL
jgi:hypothetical protein